MDSRQEELTNHEEKPINWQVRRRIFAVFVGLNLLLNYDTGVVPAALLQIDAELDLSYQEEAAIGSLVYLGVCAASFLVPYVYQRASAAQTLVLMISINVGFCLLFSFSYNIWILYLARLGMGFTQAFSVIYAPVWTNEFSPRTQATRWMGILQAAVPLGVVLGYAMTGFFINVLGDFFTWRLSVQFQAALAVPLIISLAFSDHSQIDILHQEANPRMDSLNITELASYGSQLRMLVTNPIFVFITLSLCSLYFVVIGIQFWLTVYMVQVIHADPVLVLAAFIVICTTSPLAGVLCGGYVADRLGGYRGDNLSVAIKLCVGFGLCSAAFTLPLMLASDFWAAAGLLWFLLFFGACLIPIAIGINVNCLQKEYQSTASSVSQLMFNLGGYFLAPIVSASVMDSFDDRTEGVLWGFRFTLALSFLGIVFILLAWMSSACRQKGFVRFQDHQDLSKLDPSEIQLEIIRRIGLPY